MNETTTYTGTLDGPHGSKVGRFVEYGDFHNLKQQIDVAHSEQFVTMFLGFACAYLPELHTLECPRMLEAWQAFKVEMGKKVDERTWPRKP